MIISTFLQLIVYIVALGILTAEQIYGAFVVEFVFAWISGAVNCVFSFLLFNLIVLHIYLMCRGISTYEFIVAQREKERKEKEEEDRKKVSADPNKVVHP